MVNGKNLKQTQLKEVTTSDLGSNRSSTLIRFFMEGETRPEAEEHLDDKNQGTKSFHR